MKKKDLLKIKELRETEGDSVTIKFESSEDACKARVDIESTRPMDALDFVEALVDWVQDFAMEIHKEARKREN